MTFLEGDHDPVLRRLGEEMRRAADALEFERAARLRDQLANVRKVIERQQMVGDSNEEFDAIGIHDDALEAAVQVFHVRRGRMVGRKGVIVDKVEDLTRPELLGRLLELIYGDEPDVPREVLVPEIPDDPELHAAILSARRAETTGRANAAAVAIRVPQRGEKRALPRDGHPERRGGLPPPPPAPGGRPQRPGQGAHRPAGRAGPAGRPAAHRVLRHLAHAGVRDRGVDGGAGGRPAQALRLPPLQDQVAGRPGRLRGDGGGPHAAGSPACSRTARSP